jgi:putative peptidoglycan lipid II flippase
LDQSRPLASPFLRSADFVEAAPQIDQSLTRRLMRIAPASILVQVFSFGSSIALATQLGATGATDAYYLALSVPAVAYAVLLAALRLGGIPTLTRIQRASPSVDFPTACNELVTATAVAASVFTIVVTAVMAVVLPAAAGASPYVASLTRQFIIELAPYAVTGALLGALGAILAVQGRFVMATLVLAAEPILKTVLVVVLHRQLGAQTLVIGSIAGNAIAVVLLWRAVRHEGIALRIVPRFASPVAREVVKLSAPLVISQSVLQLNPLVDRTAAANLGNGTVTVFELGVRLFTVPVSLLAATLVAPLAATWSQRLLDEGWDAVTRSFARILAAIAIAVPPLVVVGFVLRNDLVAIAYSSHAYTQDAVDKTGGVMGVLLLGLVAQIAIVPLSTLFVIRKDTVFPMKVGIANVILNAGLDLLLRKPFGVAGIAASTAITLTVLAAVYVRAAHERWGSLHLRRVLRPALVSVGSCALIAPVAVVISEAVGAGDRTRVENLVMVIIVTGAAAAIHGISGVVGGVWGGKGRVWVRGVRWVG